MEAPDAVFARGNGSECELPSIVAGGSARRRRAGMGVAAQQAHVGAGERLALVNHAAPDLADAVGRGRIVCRGGWFFFILFCHSLLLTFPSGGCPVQTEGGDGGKCQSHAGDKKPDLALRQPSGGVATV